MWLTLTDWRSWHEGSTLSISSFSTSGRCCSNKVVPSVTCVCGSVTQIITFNCHTSIIRSARSSTLQYFCVYNSVKRNRSSIINPQNLFMLFNCSSTFFFNHQVLVWKIHYSTTVLYCVYFYVFFHFSPYPRKLNDKLTFKQ